MPSATQRQVLCGPFSDKDLPDFQAAKLHAEGHWELCLSRSQYRFVSSLINRTARFGKSECKASKDHLYNGHAQADRRGYAGQNPIIEMHPDAFKRMKRELKDYGIIKTSGRYDDEYTIDYSITITDLLEYRSVIARILKDNQHGQLSTEEGIFAWATTVQSRYLHRTNLRSLQESNTTNTFRGKSISISSPQEKTLPAANANQKPKNMPATTRRLTSGGTTKRVKRSKCFLTKKALATQTRREASNLPFYVKNRGGLMRPYTKTHMLSLDKSKSNRRNEETMNNRSAKDILATVTAQVQDKSDKVRSKRRTRRTLADRCALFEQEWARGQRDRDQSVPPHRIVGRDRALLKTQIIKPVEGTELDTDAFAYWVAHNWQAIGATYFGKFKSYPERPVIPWLVKLFETYVVAWQQREHLDAEGTRSQTELMKRAAATSRVQESAASTLEAMERENALLKAQIKERDALLRSAKASHEVENDMLDADTKKSLAKGARLTFPDYDDEPAPAKKRKLRRKAK